MVDVHASEERPRHRLQGDISARLHAIARPEQSCFASEQPATAENERDDGDDGDDGYGS